MRVKTALHNGLVLGVIMTDYARIQIDPNDKSPEMLTTEEMEKMFNAMEPDIRTAVFIFLGPICVQVYL